MDLEFLWLSVVDAIETGLPLAIAFLGVWIVFRTQNNFDLTVDSSFTLGAATCTVWIIGGRDPLLALIVGCLAGALAGLLTYAVMRALGLGLILAGIIVSVGLFSVNLRILGTPNVNLLGNDTILDWWAALWGFERSSDVASISLFLALAAVVFGAVALFLLTETGLAMRASGANEIMARSQAISPTRMLMSAVVLGNALTGLAGGIVAQQQGFADVNMGLGTIVFAVTAVLLGEAVVRGRGPIYGVLAVLVGTLFYRMILAGAFRAGIQPQDFRGLTAAIVIVTLGGNRLLQMFRSRSRELLTRGHSGLGGPTSEPAEKVEEVPG